MTRRMEDERPWPPEAGYMRDLSNKDWSEECSTEYGEIGECHSPSTFLNYFQHVFEKGWELLLSHMNEIKISHCSIDQSFKWCRANTLKDPSP